jgi:hypothetical protein
MLSDDEEMKDLYVFNFLICSKYVHLCYTDYLRVSEGIFVVEICGYGLVNPDLSVNYLKL